jgi:hypothetical protein
MPSPSSVTATKTSQSHETGSSQSAVRLAFQSHRILSMTNTKIIILTDMVKKLKLVPKVALWEFTDKMGVDFRSVG